MSWSGLSRIVSKVIEYGFCLFNRSNQKERKAILKLLQRAVMMLQLYVPKGLSVWEQRALQ
jgi:hypothetical protein